jgi:elongator complex protein 1
MDQLHVSMRAAMRPADWARAADSRTRRVEEGSRIVAAPPGSVNVVLQMPRGNLETVAPRSLALPAVTAALAAGRFAAASTLAARHRVDLNLLVDYAWPSFLSRANEFVESVDDPDVVMELIEVLDSADTTAPGGVYAHLRRPDADTSNGSSTDKSGARDETVEKVAGTCSAIRAAVEARSCAAAAVGSDGAAAGVHLLDDRWELVVLSAHARTEPPDLGAALRRVGRRRELELAAVAGGGGTAGTALDSATALKHLLALVGGEALYDAALGTYDLSLAYLVGTHSAMDPGEFVADLKRLQDIESEPLRRADVDARLGRWPSCVENLLRGGNIAGACEVAERRRLFPHALAALSDVVAAEDPAAPKEPAVEVRREVTRAYAEFLSRERRHEDAAVALLSVGESRAALDEYREAIAWRPALALAARLGLPGNERASIAEELCEGLELTDPSSAAVVAVQHLGDVDRAVGSLTRAREWRESARVAYLHDRADLVETVVAPAAAEAAQGILSEATELPARLNKYLTRLRDLRHRREAMRRAIDAGAEAWRGGALGGGDDDDAASEAPSLASGVSGMSAYTDRTTGAQTATSHARSGVPSTQGGRKPTRKQRRGKKAGAGLRAGGPTEERDLAAHLASGAVDGSIGAPTALETIGELTELLVSLGHAEDAAALQRAVSEAVAALEAAREEARRRGDALNREDAAEGNGDAHEVSAGASAASKEVQTTTAQWKWAALRGSNAR